MEEPNFWDNPEEAQEQMKQLSSMKEDRDTYQKLVSAKEDMETLIEMGQEEDDDSVVPEIAEMMEEFKASFDAIRIKTLLSGEFDKDNAIIKLNAGAGGTEACDWCGMLYRMYTRWAERKGFTIEELDFLDGEEAGVKSVTFQVNGENAYGYLKSEKGVHRLVRISPFNAAGKRQTSFVSCDVMPDIKKDLDVEINDDEIRIDTYRSSGAGGQHINKTSSAIRITHYPTGIVVQCQNERSQHMNKDKAMQMLKAKLYLLEQQKQAEKQKRIRKIEEKKKRDEAQENISEKAIFSPAEERISTDKISEICKEEQIYMKESTVKKVINRIKGDRWGKWDDLITEMDGHSTSGIL